MPISSSSWCSLIVTQTYILMRFLNSWWISVVHLSHSQQSRGCWSSLASLQKRYMLASQCTPFAYGSTAIESHHWMMWRHPSGVPVSNCTGDHLAFGVHQWEHHELAYNIPYHGSHSEGKVCYSEKLLPVWWPVSTSSHVISIRSERLHQGTLFYLDWCWMASSMYKFSMGHSMAQLSRYSGGTSTLYEPLPCTKHYSCNG